MTAHYYCLVQAHQEKLAGLNELYGQKFILVFLLKQTTRNQSMIELIITRMFRNKL